MLKLPNNGDNVNKGLLTVYGLIIWRDGCKTLRQGFKIILNSQEVEAVIQVITIIMS